MISQRCDGLCGIEHDLATMFEDLHRSGWDPRERLGDQDRDGVAAEIIYPTVGMLLCNHADFDFKRACFEAYNRWLQGYCSPDPARLIGIGVRPEHVRTAEASAG